MSHSTVMETEDQKPTIWETGEVQNLPKSHILTKMSNIQAQRKSQWSVLTNTASWDPFHTSLSVPLLDWIENCSERGRFQVLTSHFCVSHQYVRVDRQSRKNSLHNNAPSSFVMHVSHEWPDAVWISLAILQRGTIRPRKCNRVMHICRRTWKRAIGNRKLVVNMQKHHPGTEHMTCLIWGRIAMEAFLGHISLKMELSKE